MWPLDSETVKNLLQRSPAFYLLVALVAGVIAVMWSLFPGAEPIAGVRMWGVALAVSVAALVIAVACAAWSAAKRHLSGQWGAWRLTARYTSLSEHQKGLLRRVYRNGRRQFDMHNIDERWFEELKEWGFVEFVPTLVYVSGMPLRYQVPVPAWKVLESLARKKRL